MILSVMCRNITLTNGVICGVMVFLYDDLSQIGMLTWYEEGEHIPVREATGVQYGKRTAQ